MKSPCKCCFISLLDSAAGVPEDRCSEILCHAHQTGSVHLHNQVIHLDPTEGKKNQDKSSGRKKRIGKMAKFLINLITLCVKKLTLPKE